LNKTVYQTNRKNLYLINIVSYSDESYINAINEDCDKIYKKVSLEKVNQKLRHSGIKFKSFWPKCKYETDFQRYLKSHKFIHTESLRLKFVIKFLNKKVSLNLNKLMHSKKRKILYDWSQCNKKIQSKLAVVDSIEYFRIYLEGTKFTLVSAQIALKWLSDFKDKNKRQFRWSTELSTYDFDVIHRPGKQLEHVAALSRAPISLTSQKPQVVSTDHMNLVTTDEVKRCQQEAALQPNGRTFASNDGLISIEANGSTKVVIPQSNKDLIKLILKEHHEDVGHPVSNRTLIQLEKTY
jgi:hypothetical protein